MKRTNKIGKEIKGISMKGVTIGTDIKKTSKLAGNVQGNVIDNFANGTVDMDDTAYATRRYVDSMSTHRNQAKKLRKSNFWNNVRETLHTIASVLVIMFILIWASVLLQYYTGQRSIGCDDRGNCYLTKV